MSIVTHPALASLLRRRQSSGSRFVFAFAGESTPWSHVVLGRLRAAWLAGDDEVRYAITATGPPDAPYRHLTVADDDRIFIEDNRGRRLDGMMALAAPDEQLHILWQRFASRLPYDLWRRMPFGNPIGAIGQSVHFRSGDATPPLVYKGRAVALRSVPGDSGYCFVTVEAEGQPAPVTLLFAPEDGAWEVYIKAGAPPVRGTVTFR